MSGLRDRLLRHNRPAGEPAEDAAAARTKAAALQDAAAASAKAAAMQDAADAEWAQIGAHMEHSEWGAFVMRRRAYGVAARHGRYALHELIGQSDQLHALLAPSGAKRSAFGEGLLPHDRLLYLDTETTGLGSGAGNVPFMIGIGFYEADQFVVEQMFIRHPGEELAMLHYLQGKLQQHPYLVSYNGKTFDWPIIKNRYILNRMPSEPEIAGHLDFLYPSRSLWKHTLPSCRLGKVEEERLHVFRHDDVPGSLAPALYFQYLAERRVSVVAGVFVHNELDIMSLAGLSIHFAGVLNGKSEPDQMEMEELYRLALWLDKLDISREAAKALELLTARLYASETEEAAEFIMPVAQIYKQQHRFSDACRLWKLYVDRKGERSTASIEPYIELSMYYEHKEKLAGQALLYAELAMQQTWQRQSLKRSYGIAGSRRTGRRAAASGDDKEQELIAGLERRIERLRGKAERAALSAQQDIAKRTVPSAEQIIAKSATLTAQQDIAKNAILSAEQPTAKRPYTPRKHPAARAKRTQEYVMDSLF